jgi:hypothetical protein
MKDSEQVNKLVCKIVSARTCNRFPSHRARVTNLADGVGVSRSLPTSQQWGGTNILG